MCKIEYGMHTLLCTLHLDISATRARGNKGALDHQRESARWILWVLYDALRDHKTAEDLEELYAFLKGDQSFMFGDPREVNPFVNFVHAYCTSSKLITVVAAALRGVRHNYSALFPYSILSEETIVDMLNRIRDASGPHQIVYPQLSNWTDRAELESGTGLPEGPSDIEIQRQRAAVGEPLYSACIDLRAYVSRVWYEDVTPTTIGTIIAVLRMRLCLFRTGATPAMRFVVMHPDLFDVITEHGFGVIAEALCNPPSTDGDNNAALSYKKLFDYAIHLLETVHYLTEAFGAHELWMPDGISPDLLEAMRETMDLAIRDMGRMNIEGPVHDGAAAAVVRTPVVLIGLQCLTHAHTHRRAHAHQRCHCPRPRSCLAHRLPRRTLDLRRSLCPRPRRTRTCQPRTVPHLTSTSRLRPQTVPARACMTRTVTTCLTPASAMHSRLVHLCAVCPGTQTRLMTLRAELSAHFARPCLPYTKPLLAPALNHVYLSCLRVATMPMSVHHSTITRDSRPKRS